MKLKVNNFLKITNYLLIMPNSYSTFQKCYQ
uniref:Uncharacterized protein n=1 Tax=Anguilla anguilla TaxID=7936 RepID=A0A0E9RH31_ANGAN